MRTKTFAVIGATGTIGREVLISLAELDVPAAQVRALASARSIGTAVSYAEDEDIRVDDLATFDFAGVDIALFATTATVAAKEVPRAAKAGAVAIDLSPQFRLDPDVPLVVPEVNAAALDRFGRRRIVASPGVPSILAAMILKPLAALARPCRVVVTSLEPVSGQGREAMDELFNQTRAVYVNDQSLPEQFPKRIAFNLIPHVGAFLANGATEEEERLPGELRKLIDGELQVAVTAVRVPVFIGHALTLAIEFDGPISEAAARAALKAAPGVSVIDHRQNEGYVTPQEVPGEDEVFVSRIRRDASVKHGLLLWVVGDNLRKGSALNLVQIASALVARHLTP